MTEREPMSNEERRSALEIMRKCVEHSPTCPCKICELNSEACECESCKKAYAAFASTEPEQPAKLYDCAACGIVRGCDDEECCLECGHSVFPATVVEPASEGEETK